MPGPVATTRFDHALEEHALRKQGLLGRGANRGNALYSIDHDCLPPEARRTIDLIASDGPFPFPGKDGTSFGNRFGDLPTRRYLEYTVVTPGIVNRGMRRIAARKQWDAAHDVFIFRPWCDTPVNRNMEKRDPQGSATSTRTSRHRFGDQRRADPVLCLFLE